MNVFTKINNKLTSVTEKEIVVVKEILLVQEDDFVKFDQLKVGDYLLRYTGWCGNPKDKNHNGLFKVVEITEEQIILSFKRGETIIPLTGMGSSNEYRIRGSESMEGYYCDYFKRCQLVELN